ncbi:PRC-barrel domain-containing protein [Parafrankia elaeagni]|uniref:PRC-barrel domain-containing protein n=1 Tax=Parafrankia elaeagni TaxID=222534 RepID=UPI000375E691|nr:PRC-barrel domain-containing protein [Parafrankia elaeagni]
MTLLVRAKDLARRPVVTLAGDDVAQIKDVVFDSHSGAVAGFTLSGRGLFAGPLKTALPVSAVRGVGLDAVMIDDQESLVEGSDMLDRRDVRERDVLGDHVVTDTGVEVGTVTDVILRGGPAPEVAGYEVQTTSTVQPADRKVLIPLPDTLAASGEAVVVPGRALDFAAHDIAGFGAALAEFRSHHDGES